MCRNFEVRACLFTLTGQYKHFPFSFSDSEAKNFAAVDMTNSLLLRTDEKAIRLMIVCFYFCTVTNNAERGDYRMLMHFTASATPAFDHAVLGLSKPSIPDRSSLIYLQIVDNRTR